MMLWWRRRNTTCRKGWMAQCGKRRRRGRKWFGIRVEGQERQMARKSELNAKGCWVGKGTSTRRRNNTGVGHDWQGPMNYYVATSSRGRLLKEQNCSVSPGSPMFVQIPHTRIYKCPGFDVYENRLARGKKCHETLV